MGNFSIGNVKCDKQMAVAYILYLVGGSCFEKAEASNRIMEGNLKGQYLEFRGKGQEEQEGYVSGLMEKLGAEYLDALSSLRCAVHIKRAEGIFYLWFQTGFEELIAFVDRRGRIGLEKGYAISKGTWARVRAVPKEKKDDQTEEKAR